MYVEYNVVLSHGSTVKVDDGSPLPPLAATAAVTAAGGDAKGDGGEEGCVAECKEASRSWSLMEETMLADSASVKTPVDTTVLVSVATGEPGSEVGMVLVVVGAPAAAAGCCDC